MKLASLLRPCMEILVNLQQLRLSGNAITDAVLLDSGIENLPIVMLDLSDNKVSRDEALVRMIDAV